MNPSKRTNDADLPFVALRNANDVLRLKVKELEERLLLSQKRAEFDASVVIDPAFCNTLVKMCLHVRGDLTELQYLVDACYGLIGQQPPNLWELNEKQSAKEDSPIGKERNGK